MTVWRPCDVVETAAAWQSAIENNSGPTSLILTRQGLPHQVRTPEQIENISRGGYILKESEKELELILIATGSEIGLAVQAWEKLTAMGHGIRVVSMPCCELFNQQDSGYRETVLPYDVKRRIAVEAGSTGLWRQYVGTEGQVIGMDCFGESAPAAELFEHFGFTADNVIETAEALLS